MSADKDKKELLKQIVALEFTIIGLNLYLNTHPRDREALNKFNQTVKEIRALKETYEKR